MRLKLPITIRLPHENEIPKSPSLLQQLSKAKSANIVEGFTIKLNDLNSENGNLGFEFYSEINIDNVRLWKLVMALAMSLPEVVAPLFGMSDCEVTYGQYFDKIDVVEFLSKFKRELTQDSFMEFGLLYHDEESLVEVFITDSKYIKFWGSDSVLFQKIMRDFDLNEIENLEFIDEYPKVREPLHLFTEDITDTRELINILTQEFK